MLRLMCPVFPGGDFLLSTVVNAESNTHEAAWLAGAE